MRRLIGTQAHFSRASQMRDGKRVVAVPRIRRLLSPAERFMKAEASGGIVLVCCAIAALVIANSPLWEAYDEFLHMHIVVGIPGIYQIDMTIHHWINDWLMAVFFFLVGMEIKREILVGELASFRKALLPIAAAIGGMAVPAAIYVAINLNSTDPTTMNGWGVPMATDIAFAVGVIALLGRRVPLALKVFLVALAIIDDIGAVLVIALFYTDAVHFDWLMLGMGAVCISVIMNLLGVRSPYVYLAIGGAVWLGFLESGVHATIAGVLMAFTIPVKRELRESDFADRMEQLLNRFREASIDNDDITTNERQQTTIFEMEKACTNVQPPLMQLEHGLLRWVSFGVMPIFALANAGVHIGGHLVESLTSAIALGIGAGLVFGKSIGIFSLTWLAVRMNLASLPRGTTWLHIFGVSCLAGIGFTMSLFIATLAFGRSDEFMVDAKIGILGGSLIAAVLGSALLYLASQRADRQRSRSQHDQPAEAHLDEHGEIAIGQLMERSRTSVA